MCAEKLSNFNMVSGVFSIIGAIVGGVIGYLSARAMSIRSARIGAAAKLRAAFAPEIAQMRLFASGQRVNVEQLLASAFPRHAAAIEEFSFYLGKKQKEKYYKAWREYYEVGGSVRFFNYYMGEGEEPHNLFFSRIHAILQFTES